jgi:hypothetical protein
MGLWYNISKERAAKIRIEVTDEVRDELKAKLTPVLREQVEEELWDKARQQARQQAKREVLEGQPTGRQKEGFLEFVRETELDSHAQATVASGEADQHASKVRWTRRLLGPLPWMVFLGAWPALYALWQWVGALVSVEFIGASVGLLAAFLVLLVTGTRRRWRYEDRAKRLYKIASDYLVLAERAKTFRLVHAERMESKKRLDDLTEQLRRAKVDLDDKFHPSVASVDEARNSVRHRISLEGLNIGGDEDFEERLEEAEREAQAEAEAVRG